MPAVAENFRRKHFVTDSHRGYGRRSDAGARKMSPYMSGNPKGVASCRILASHPAKVVRGEPRAHVKTWSVLPVNTTPITSTELVFNHLAERWRADTLYDSSLEAICFHPAYQTIMAMGEKALPLILGDLANRFGHWFYALGHITRMDVARGAENLEEARQRWLEWGRKENFI